MRPSMFLKFCLILFFVFLCYLTPNVCNAGSLEVANGFFYNSQYDKAIPAFEDALATSNDKSTKTKIKYKIGLSYFLLGDIEKSLEYWKEAKQENPGIFTGKIFRIPSTGMEPLLIIGDMIIIDNEYYQHKEIVRGDVAVFSNPEAPKKMFIKRVMALPGDKILLSNLIITICFYCF